MTPSRPGASRRCGAWATSCPRTRAMSYWGHGWWRHYWVARLARASLHRRLFIWFGVSILASGLAFIWVMHMGGWHGGWGEHEAPSRARTFAAFALAAVVLWLLSGKV